MAIAFWWTGCGRGGSPARGPSSVNGTRSCAEHRAEEVVWARAEPLWGVSPTLDRGASRPGGRRLTALRCRARAGTLDARLGRPRQRAQRSRRARGGPAVRTVDGSERPQKPTVRNRALIDARGVCKTERYRVLFRSRGSVRCWGTAGRRVPCPHELARSPTAPQRPPGMTGWLVDRRVARPPRVTAPGFDR